jgi:hypothetical protein
MVSGLLLASLIILVQVFITANQLIYLINRLGPEFSEMYFTMISSLSGLSGLLFAIGFAFHGVRTSRIQARITELEMMNLTQATELERLRNR